MASNNGENPGATTGGSNNNPNVSTEDLPPLIPGRERHVLQRREELRFEVTFGGSASSTMSNASGTTTFCLQKGSCELYGCELALGKTYTIAHGGVKAALFTWHGCVVDLGAADDGEGSTSGVEFFSYTSDETDANVAFVNAHAQLEALRDDAAAENFNAKSGSDASSGGSNGQGPRVMIVGPPECGKTTLTKTLVAYACKVGRTPLMVDLDPMDNTISVPGALAVAPMHQSAVAVETYATTGLPVNGGGTGGAGTGNSNTNGSTPAIHPLVIYHGSTAKLHPDLFRGQVDSLTECIEKRLQADELGRSSGIIVNTNGWIRDEGYDCLLHAAKALKITVLLVVGHDRLYSMLTSHYKKQQKHHEEQLAAAAESGEGSTIPPLPPPPKILKVPRSGGVVSRPSRFVASCRSRAVKRYFYGDLVADPNNNSTGDTIDDGAGKPHRLVNQLTPFAIQLPFAEIKIYKVSSMALSNSLLPVNAAHQSTDAIQLAEIDIVGDPEAAKGLQHALLAVCHPTAVARYEQTGKGRDLVTAGVAGFCAVDKVVTETDQMHLLSPCAGVLPSKTFVVGDITWME
ncbi:unnamed protein product [Pseudo-nitzschia multistriata]|uniref:Protein CLP1 homolog n=1 Tax=Pseudo-nitzschia multistriata TaxID=183589 RepID=A0A448YZY3_9STRA|nr:unnamed protein product [Pseudo-nitzschia multistriata]